MIQISTDFVLFFSSTKSIYFNPLPRQHFFSEKRLGTWAYTTISVYVRERWKKCCVLFSQIYTLGNWVGIVTAIKDSILYLKIKSGRRLGPRFEIRRILHEDRLDWGLSFLVY